MFKRTLVVVAHPDDDVLGCGATLASLADDGNDIKIIFLAEGVSCRYDESKIFGDHVKIEIIKRNNLARDAMKIMGVSEFTFYDLPCGRLDTVPIIDLAKIVEAEISEFKPDTVLTHSAYDVNNDHKLVFQACLQATRPGSDCRVANLLSFEVSSSTEWKFIDQFPANYFINVGMYIETKIRAMEAYDVELRNFPHPRSIDGIRTMSKYRGMQSGVEHAEAFQVIRMISG